MTNLQGITFEEQPVQNFFEDHVQFNHESMELINEQISKKHHYHKPIVRFVSKGRSGKCRSLTKDEIIKYYGSNSMNKKILL